MKVVKPSAIEVGMVKIERFPIFPMDNPNMNITQKPEELIRLFYRNGRIPILNSTENKLENVVGYLVHPKNYITYKDGWFYGEIMILQSYKDSVFSNYQVTVNTDKTIIERVDAIIVSKREEVKNEISRLQSKVSMEFGVPLKHIKEDK